MKERQKRHTKRIRNLVITLVLTALILSVSTYAWFIGMRTVSVSEFSVEIATTKELLLSLNGKDWTDSVSINKANHDDDETTVYEGHTNWWAGEGLVPMSSVGKIDSEASRLVLFEKASMTQSDGGFRIMTSRTVNDVEAGKEAEGYVAFDLFIKNYSGADYIYDLNEKNEEAIYLSTDSAVKVSDIDGVEGTGIENSVRVAFAQIGRVKETTEDVSVITGITCTDVPSVVTGICTRTAQIWEPNDTKHVAGAISWYETACRARTSKEVFSGTCTEIADNTTYPTYAVAGPIGSEEAVDVYDGKVYNGYEGSITEEDAETPLLYEFPYFTDTMKNLEGMERPQFMTLAPNSITKVRIYVYIEGQDIDNYDFAAIGKSISVKFGFTKQRFTKEDFKYTDPTTREKTTTTQP